MKGHLTQFGVSGLSQRKRHLSGHQKDEWESAQWKIKEGQSVLDKEDNEAKTCGWESSSALLGPWKQQAKSRLHEVLLLLLLFSHAWLFMTLWAAARRLPCPLLSPGVCSNSCPLSQWCHSTISSTVSPFSSCPQFFPASGSFAASRLFTSGGQNGAWASASGLPIPGWFPLGLTDLISQSKGLSRVFSSTTIWKHQFFSTQPSLWSNCHIRTWLLEKPTIWTFVGKVMSLLFNMLSSFAIAFLPRRKHLLILWPQSLSTVILEPKKMKSVIFSDSCWQFDLWFLCLF